MTTGGRKTAIAITTMVVVVLVAIFELSRVGGNDSERRAERLRVPAGAQLRTPAASSTSVPPAEAASTSYVVARGDTLTSIARHFQVSTAAIIAANQLLDPDTLAVGARIVIPPPAPVALVLTPTSISGGTPVELRLTGAKPGENVTFTIVTPSGTFTGPPHAASYDGSVVTSYRPDPGALGGLGTVNATGDRGTVASATFGIVV